MQVAVEDAVTQRRSEQAGGDRCEHIVAGDALRVECAYICHSDTFETLHDENALA